MEKDYKMYNNFIGGRYLWADSLKGLLMMCVILGHVIQFVYDNYNSSHLFNYIYSFHMPCFMAISGYLSFRTDSRKANYIRRFRQLLIPYLSWSILLALLLGKQMIKIILDPNGYFWFLWTLFWIYVLFGLSKSIAKKSGISEDLISLALCVFLMSLMVLLDFRLFGFQFIAYYYVFYYFGFLFHKYELQNMISLPLLMLMSLLWIFLGWNWTMHSLPEWMPKIASIPNAVIQYAYRGVTAILAIIILLKISPKLLDSRKRLNVFVGSFGKMSLGIYTVHLLLIKIVAAYIPTIAQHIRGNILFEVLFMIFLTLFSIGIVQILNKNKFSAYAIGKI